MRPVRHTISTERLWGARKGVAGFYWLHLEMGQTFVQLRAGPEGTCALRPTIRPGVAGSPVRPTHRPTQNVVL
jgi:hypothetical protein